MTTVLTNQSTLPVHTTGVGASNTLPDSTAVYVITCQPHTDTLPFSQPGFFFNDAAHLGQQSSLPARTLSVLNRLTQQTEARCTFFIDADRAVSPIAAPFGSVEFVPTLPDAVLERLLDALLNEARQTGAPSLRLVNYPHCYAHAQANRLTHHLLRRGFRVTESHPNSFLPITSEPFSAGLDPQERRRLRKCLRAGFRFEHWQKPDVTAVTSFLTEIRQQQGYTLALPTNRLAQLLRQFPEQFVVFAVTDGSGPNNIAAMTVAVRVRPDILYNFLPASSPSYRTYSPAVLLTEGLYMHCQQQGIRLLDLGVSLGSDRQPKPSLIRFKRNLGALESPKLVFENVF